jgi:hypothetical protein
MTFAPVASIRLSTVVACALEASSRCTDQSSLKPNMGCGFGVSSNGA